MNKNVPGREIVEDYYNTLIDDDEVVAKSKPESPKQASFTDNRKTKKKKHLLGWLIAAAVIFFVFFTPFRINILLLGIDPTKNTTAQGRSDTMILSTIPPVSPYMHFLSIPRDLWVDIPGHGQNRINTAHFFAEVAQEGSGPAAAAQTVELNFHVSVPYTVRIRVEGFKDIVDAMGGVTVYLPEDMSGLKAGYNTLDATAALRFVRDRKGSDDFYRQQRAHIFLAGAMKKMMNPLNWWRIPGVLKAAVESVSTNVPVYLYPRIAYSVMFSAVKGFDMYTLDHGTMATGWITPDGADVLVPHWDLIAPLVNKLFRGF